MGGSGAWLVDACLLALFPPSRPFHVLSVLEVQLHHKDQMRIGNGVCCGRHRNLNIAPIDWKSLCRRVCLVCVCY